MMNLCQSCAILLTDDSLKGPEKDGKLSEKYCKHFYI